MAACSRLQLLFVGRSSPFLRITRWPSGLGGGLSSLGPWFESRLSTYQKKNYVEMRLVHELAFCSRRELEPCLVPYLPQPASCGGHPPVAFSGSTALQSTRASPLTRAAQRDQEAQKRAWLQPDLRSDRQVRICFVQKLLTHSSVLLEGKPTGVPGKPSQRSHVDRQK